VRSTRVWMVGDWKMTQPVIHKNIPPTPEMQEEMSNVEASFSHYWRLLSPLDLPPLFYDCVQPVPNRKHRLDYACVPAGVGIECQGGVHGTKKRGHTRPAKYLEDCWKLAYCLAAGWLVFWVTEEMLKNEPERFVRLVAGVIRDRLNPV